MGLITLHRKYSFVDYQNSLCSFASMITIITLLTASILPLIWIFQVNSYQFSLRNDLIAFEQPMVKFQFKYIFVFEHSMDDFSGKVMICSSFDNINSQLGTHEDCAKLKFIEKDVNFDGIVDMIEFSVSIGTNFNYGIKSASLVLFLDSRLEHNCQFKVPSAVILKKSFINNLNDRQIVIKGSLQPNQKQALVCPFLMRNIKSHFFHDTLELNQTNLKDFKIAKIQETLDRNPLHFFFQEISTDFEELETQSTSVKIKLSIPETETRYKKTFWQVVNDVWINYIAIFIVTYVVCNFVLNQMFENRWLMARKRNLDLKSCN